MRRPLPLPPAAAQLATYTLPPIGLRRSGRSGGARTQILNMRDIVSCFDRHLLRDVDLHLLHFISHHCHCQATFYTDPNRYYLRGYKFACVLQIYLERFISFYFVCRNCRGTSTTLGRCHTSDLLKHCTVCDHSEHIQPYYVV